MNPHGRKQDGFKKSSFSGGDAGTCVEVALESTIRLRQSKDPQGAVLQFTPAEWDAFVKGVKAGEFDLA